MMPPNKALQPTPQPLRSVGAAELGRQALWTNLTDRNPMPTELLFSYGTLQLEAVQMATFGRQLTGTRDVLPGFETALLEIDDQATISLSGKTHHAIAKFTGHPSDSVSGTVFAVTPEELQSADKYEVAAYKRVAVLLRSGVRAWAYVDARYAPSDS